MPLELSDGKNSDIKKILGLEWIKICNDPIYFAKKYFTIQHPLRGKIPFDLYPFQERTLKEINNHHYNIILKSRQLGISTLCACMALHRIITKADQNVLIMATKIDVAKNMFIKVQEGFKGLPGWMKAMIGSPLEDNKLGVRLRNGSQIKAVTSTSDSGRSEALSLLIVDECLGYESKIKIRNKKTGEIREIQIGELFNNQDFI